MSSVDFRCLVSGLSLLNTEVAVMLLAQAPGRKAEALTLPIFGVLGGEGGLCEMPDGPNADLILAAFQEDLANGLARIDWTALGVSEVAVEHMETLMNLVLCAEMGDVSAITWRGARVGLCLMNAHIAAALMEREAEFDSATHLDQLPDVVLMRELGARIYAPLADCSLKLRCRFGLSFVGTRAVLDFVRSTGGALQGPGAGILADQETAADWLVEARERFDDEEDLLEALLDHASSQLEEESSLS